MQRLGYNQRRLAMKVITTKILLIILLILCIGGVCIACGEPMEKPSAEKDYDIVKIRENLEEAKIQGENTINTIFARISSENQLIYSISTEDAVKEKFRQLNLSSDNYYSDAKEIMDNTDPEVLLQYIENQCEKAVSALSDLTSREAGYTCDEKDEQGNTDIMKIYDLGDGTEIVLQETDCADDSSKSNRSYTVSYAIVVGGTMQGKFAITNHYSIDKNEIVLMSAEAKRYDGNGPLTVELRDKAWESSTKNISQIGEEVYTGADFYLTCSKGATIGTAKGSADKSRGVVWNENRTRLHKIYAAVKVKDMKENGISAETYGRLICLK